MLMTRAHDTVDVAADDAAAADIVAAAADAAAADIVAAAADAVAAAVAVDADANQPAFHNHYHP
jgi:diadenosine tetraphosphate (Ap4A) HIT family hydrolase